MSLLPAVARCENSPPSSEQAEMMGRVEDFLLHNFRDVIWRKSLEWGEVRAEKNGARSIRYTYEAQIWDKDHLVMCQEFTFDKAGKLLAYKNADGYPKKKEQTPADVSTQQGMIDLVENFFKENFRDVTTRKTIAWGQPIQDDNRNSSIQYKYEATIWNKDKKVIEGVFTFDPNGKFVSVREAKNADGANP